MEVEAGGGAGAINVSGNGNGKYAHFTQSPIPHPPTCPRGELGMKLISALEGG